MLPLLEMASDNAEHTQSDAIERMVVVFGLSEDDRKQMVPSQTDFVLGNRIRWARFYLRKALLLETTTKRKFRITERGRQVLAEHPGAINSKYLSKFAEFAAFRGAAGPGAVPTPTPDVQGDENPEEALEASYQLLRGVLVQDIQERLKQCSPAFFERLVVDVLVAMGYGGSRQDAGLAVGQSGDGGIDGVIKEDRLGLNAVYVQAKKWSTPVGRPIVQAFAGSLLGQGGTKGVLIATSQFTKEAHEYVGRIAPRIVLVDGIQLANFMIEHNVGVAEVATYRVLRVDEDYFANE